MKTKLFPWFALLIFAGKISAQGGLPAAFHDKANKKTPKEIIIKFVSPANLDEELGKVRNNTEKTEILYRLCRYYSNNLKIDSSLQVSEKIKAIAIADNNEQVMATYHLTVAGALLFRARHQELREHLDKAIPVFLKFNNADRLGVSYMIYGSSCDQQGQMDCSQKHYHQAVSLLQKVGDARELQRALYELGRNYYKINEVDSCVFYLLRSLKLAEELEEPTKIFNAANYLGLVYLSSGNIENAGRYLEYALASRTSTTSKVQLRNLWMHYGDYTIIRKDWPRARAAITELTTLNSTLNDNWGTIMAYLLEGKYETGTGHYDKAVLLLRKAYDRRGEIVQFGYDIKNIAFHLGQAEISAGDYPNGIKHLHHARLISKDLHFLLDELESDRLLSEAFHLQNRDDSAFHYYRFYTGLKDSLLTLQKEKAVAQITLGYETEKKEQQIVQLQNEKKLDEYQLQLQLDQIERQNLLDTRKNQQLALLSQQNEINRLQASEKSLAMQFQEKEIVRQQNELAGLTTEKKLQVALTRKQTQQKQIAYGAGIIILLLGGYAYFRAVQNRKLSNRLAVSVADLKQAQEQLILVESEKAAENIRVRISRDIHDEVGATLSGVALFSEIAKQKMDQHQQQDAMQYLGHISTSSKEMVEKMSDIVWTINPQNDSFERIISKLQSYGVNLCGSKAMQFTTQVDPGIRNYHPSMQVRKDIYLLLKEAINNAVKYSGGKNVFLGVEKQGDRIKAIVKDDGKGFDSTLISPGNGLGNMKARAAELRGSLDISSVPGTGTTVHLQFDFHPSGGHPEVV